MNLIRLFYAVIIMFSYPLECFVCREVIENTFFYRRKGDKLLHSSITIVISLLTMLLSFTTDCLGVVLELNVSSILIFSQKKRPEMLYLFCFKGSLVATSLAYILPSICTILINFRIERKIFSRSIIMPLLVGLVGIVVLVSGVVSAVHKITSGYGCSHGSEMVYCSRVSLNNTNGTFYDTSQPRFLNVTARDRFTTVTKTFEMFSSPVF